MKYEKLFSPGKIGNVELKNRIVMAPMVMGVGEPDGTPGEQMMRYYEERAKGGAGLIITEATRVDDSTGTLAPKQLAMSRDKHIAPFSEMVRRVHAHGAKIFCQLHHPGRQNYSILIGTMNLSQAIGSVWNGYWDIFFKLAGYNDKLEKTGLLMSVVAPSNVPCRHQNQKTRALRRSEIKKIIEKFGDAALRIKKAGADGVELHAAHGYLIQQFLSPHTNRREDEYGGSFENRMRFITEIIEDIRAKCGRDFPVAVRLSADEFYREIGEPGQGIELAEGVKIAKALEVLGVDAIDVSSATYETMNYWLEPVSFPTGWRAYLAKTVKENVNIPVLAANLTRTPAEAEARLTGGVQDFVSLARPLLADPYWAAKAETGRDEDIKRCICCLWCFENMLKGGFDGTAGGCAVNPRTGHEYIMPDEPAKSGGGRTVAVIGAGPAGLMAAETLGRRGFAPIVFEKDGAVGGQLRLAAAPPGKDKTAWCYEDLEHAAKENGAEIRFNTPATIEELKALNPYAVILASGGEAITPGVDGVRGDNVSLVTKILDGSVKIEGKTVAIIGSGMTGLEAAELLCEQGNRVVIVEMADTIAPGMYHQHLDDIIPRLKKRNTAFFTNSRLEKIFDGAVLLKDTRSGDTRLINADHVVLSVGVKSRDEMEGKLREAFENVYVIGDAKAPGRIADAVRAGYETASALK